MLLSYRVLYSLCFARPFWAGLGIAEQVHDVADLSTPRFADRAAGAGRLCRVRLGAGQDRSGASGGPLQRPDAARHPEGQARIRGVDAQPVGAAGQANRRGAAEH